jgi:hypothetical protein
MCHGLIRQFNAKMTMPSTIIPAPKKTALGMGFFQEYDPHADSNENADFPGRRT